MNLEKRCRSLWEFSLLTVSVVMCVWFWPADSIGEELITIRPSPAPGALDNPLKGWCPYTDAGPIRQPYSMVFQYVSWRELEPREGEYRFEQWEQRWNVTAAKDKHIIFRVYVDYPSLPSGLPEWLRAAGVKERDYKAHGGGKSPDYDDPRMIAAMERLIAALGERYDRHPRIAFIQLGLLGFWGEWHTWPREQLFASPTTRKRVIQTYRRAFPNKSLMIRYADGFAGQQDWIGFHDDMFPQDTDNGEEWSFLSRMRAAKRTNNWRRAVVGGEMVPNQAARWLGGGFETTQTMLERAHFTWIGPYCPALEQSSDADFRARSESLVRRLGYNFQLVEVAHSASFRSKQAARLTLRGKNTGVAPFYYPWPVEWALLGADGMVAQNWRTKWDVRDWQPGAFEESTDMLVDAPPGKYRLAIGIIDPWKKRPAIQFANDLSIQGGWSILTTIQVEP